MTCLPAVRIHVVVCMFALAQSLVPDSTIGTISLFGGREAPIGYLLCNGSYYSQRVYPALYSVIGLTFVPETRRAATNASGMFAVPDSRGLFVVGAGGSASYNVTPRALGAVVGNETITLLPANLPSHSHSGKSSDRSTSGVASGGNPSSGSYFSPQGYSGSLYKYCNDPHTHDIANVTCDQCRGTPLRSTPPALGLNLIIKADTAAAPTPAPNQTCNSTSFRAFSGVDLSGVVVGPGAVFLATSEADCLSACCAQLLCTAYSYQYSLSLFSASGSAPCFLLANVTTVVPANGYSSGALISAYS